MERRARTIIESSVLARFFPSLLQLDESPIQNMHTRVLTCAVLALVAGPTTATAQTVLAVDFNARAGDSPTQPGFSAFTMTSGSGIQTDPSTRTFGDFTVTVANSGAPGYDDRARGGPTDSGSFTESALLRDFIFSRENTSDTGLDVTIAGLMPAATYRFTLWSFDASSPGNRVSDWTINEQLFTNGYAFNGSVAPTENQKYQFSVVADTDVTGQVVIRGRRNPASVDQNGAMTFGVFLNALRVELPGVTPPAIVRDPAAATVFAGDRAILSVVSSGTVPLDYHWSQDGNVVQVTGSGRLVISNAQPSAAGSYSVIVSNSSGTATSAVAQVTVQAVDNVATGLLAYWPLNELTDFSPDSSPNAHHLWATNMNAGSITDGPTSPALAFDGSSQFLTRTNDPVDVLPAAAYSSYTIAMWVRGDGVSQLDRRVFAESSNTNNNPLVTIGTGNVATNAVNIYIRNNDGTVALNHRKTSLVAFDGTWHHVAWVDNNGYGTVYVDGVPDTNDFSYNRSTISANIETVGAVYRTNAVAYFAGSVDEVSIWRRALSPDEITHVKNFGPLTTLPPQTQLLTVQANTTTVTLTFLSENPAEPHVIEQTTDLGGSPIQWTEVADVTFSANGNTVTAQFAQPASQHAFFRVRQD